MMNRNVDQHAGLWIVGAFFATLVLSLGSVAVFYTPHKALGIALATSARAAFLFFWAAYVGGALYSLFGTIFLPLKTHGRQLGLAFAAALLVHLGYVASLCVLSHAPPTETFIIFGSAAISTYGLALLSIDRVRRMLPAALWIYFRSVAMNYIALAFFMDFAKFPINSLTTAALYLPFAALAAMGPLLKLAAWMQKLTRTPAASAAP